MMLQVINFLLNFNQLKNTLMGGIFGLICDVYVTIARVYDILMNIVTTKIDIDETLSSLTGTIYVLMAIFMLFRITISFLNMLIDPDKVTDKKVGARAVIWRTFVTIILLIALKPGSYVMNFLDRVEDALLAKDGLIANFVGSFTYNSLKITDSSSNDGVSDCYFFVNKVWGPDNFITSSDANYAYHFRVSTDSTKLNNPKGVITDTFIKGVKYNYYYEIVNDTISYNGVSYAFKGDSGFIQFYTSMIYGNGKNSCPAYISSKYYPDYNSGFYGGTFRNNNKTPSEFHYEVYSSEERFLLGLGKFYMNDVNGDFIKVNYHDMELENLASVAGAYYAEYNETNVSDSSLAFSRGILKSFMTSSDGDLNQITEKLLLNSAANEAVFDEYNNGKIGIDMLISLLAGIAVVVYLIFICVDAILRFLKLKLLQLISPIAIINFINPDSKIFDEWKKMYLTTYVDLFIKLLVIGIITQLLDVVMKIPFVGWARLFYILGLLVFIKVIPTIINKIFGINISESSFKDIYNVAKKGITTTSGAVIGGIVGRITGKGVGAGIRGALYGAGTGFKGDFTGGAKNIANRNYKRNQMKDDKLNLFDRMLVDSGINIWDKEVQDKIKTTQEVKNKNDAFNEFVIGKIKSDGGVTVNGYNMQAEYKHLEDLQKMGSDKYTARNSGKTERDYYQAVINQENLVKRLEKQAVSQKINTELRVGNQEMISQVNELNSAIDDACHKGVKGFIKINKNTTSQTISDNEDNAYRKINELNKTNKKAIKRSKYMSGDS